jgi:integrase
MAAITRRGGKWNVRIRRRGYPLQSKTFKTKAAAERWAREVEGKIDDHAFVPTAREAERVTLGEALKRYADEVTKKKRSPRPEELKIAKLREHELASRMLATLRSHDFAALRDELEERDLAPNTVRLYLAPLSHLFTIARTEWGYEGLRNPLEDVAKPSTLGTARDRRLHDGELDRLQLAEGAPAWLPSVITLAVETAMRRGEIAGLHDGCIRGRVARLALTKNGEGRSVPLSPDALAAIATLRQLGGGKLRMPAAATMTHEFAAACQAAGIKDLRFHDLRHEATSRLFERGLALPEVAAITGHKTWAMLKRYTHPKAEKIADKLARAPEIAGA